MNYAKGQFWNLEWIFTPRFTTNFVSPIICNREMEQVNNSSKTFNNMSIKTRLFSREVVAMYTVDEISMELVVKLSPSHPFGHVTVECGKRVGVSNAQWRNWMLQLTQYLMQQVWILFYIFTLSLLSQLLPLNNQITWTFFSQFLRAYSQILEIYSVPKFHIGIWGISLYTKTRDPLLCRQREFIFAWGLLK